MGPMRRRHLVLAVEICLAVVYCAAMVGVVEGLGPNVDEGVYTQQAWRILQGQVPYRDFFLHQTPLYLYQQAGVFGVFGGVTLLTMRLPSVVAIALSGVFLSRWTTRITGFWQAGVVAEFVWLMSPQQYDVAIAIPNALAILCALVALYIDAGRGRYRRWTSALWFVLALLAKPTAIVFGIALLLPQGGQSPTDRLRQIIWPLATVSLVAFLVLLAMSDGRFGSLMLAQFARFGRNSGYRVLMDNTLMQMMADRLGATTVFAWNWRTVAQAYGILRASYVAAFAPLSIAAGAAALGYGHWRNCGWVVRGWQRSLLILGVIVISLIWVWDPTWPHYAAMALVPLAALAGQIGYGVWLRVVGGRAVTQVIATLILGVILTAWIAAHAPRPTDYFSHMTDLLEPQDPRPVLSFYPAVSLLAGRKTACDFIDPLNYTGSIRDILVDASNIGVRVDAGSELRKCADAQGALVWLDVYSAFFTSRDPQWHKWLHTLEPERVVFESEVARYYYTTGTLP